MSIIAPASSTSPANSAGPAKQRVVVDPCQASPQGDRRSPPRAGPRRADRAVQAAPAIVPPISAARGRLVKARVLGRLEDHVEAGGGTAVRGIGGEHDPLGRDPREQLEHVEREEAGAVVEHSGVVREPGRDQRLVADRAVREDQDHRRVLQGKVHEPVRERRQASAGVDQDRHVRVLGRAKTASISGPSKSNCCARGCSLMPRAPAARQRSPSPIASSAGSRRQNGINRPSLSRAQASTRSLGTRYAGWRSGSCSANVHALCRPGIELRQQPREIQRAPVLVQAQVGVSVDHFRALRPQGRSLGFEGR